MSNCQEKIGGKIKKYRSVSGLSQQTLAERAGISYKYLGEIERGQVNLSVEILSKISKALNISSAELMDDPEQESEKLAKIKFLLSELSVEDLDIAVDMLEVLHKHSRN
ncbi:helix-turn-helix domain-containing protein [Maridesulfovibrio sp.]|uniref:helix-turn-helix domain-containing protein n=1 Tax=unclassified Maridesulfovibrio TaxID=2794999 RepID=UPI003B004EC1